MIEWKQDECWGTAARSALRNSNRTDQSRQYPLIRNHVLALMVVLQILQQGRIACSDQSSCDIARFGWRVICNGRDS
jgi:hypothetical protein